MDPPKKPKDVPFYKTPQNVKTAAQIIEEAKNSLNRPQVRSLSTRRPETPQEGQRKLFGEQSVRDPKNRPPSAISVGSRHFDSESRPVSGTRLVPLDHANIRPKPNFDKLDLDSKAPKPPADPNRPIKRPISRQRHYQHSTSVDGGEPGQPISARGKSGSWTDMSSLASPGSSVPSTPEGQRRVHSGPKERTPTQEDYDSSEVSSRSESRSKRSSSGREGDRIESGYGSGREGSAGSLRGHSAGKPVSADRRDSGSGRRDGSAGQRESSAGRREGSAGKREGSAGRRESSAGKRDEKESNEESEFYNRKIGPIVDKMAAHIKDKNSEELSELTDTLYLALDEANLLGKNCKRRPAILKTVFKLLDLESPVLLLKLSRLILALKVSGNNLTNVCKLVFKVAREDQNDGFFLDQNMLDLLLDTVKTTDHTVSPEALTYCTGSLKVLCQNTNVVKYLAKRHAVDTLGKLITTINRTTQETGKHTDQLGHVLVQVTACLRNLADVSGTRTQFLRGQPPRLVDELCRLMDLYPHDADLMLNVSRIFSKMTTHVDCCSALSDSKDPIKGFLNTLQKYPKNDDLVLRISFILGNLTARNDRAREILFEFPKALDVLMSIFKLNLEQDLKETHNKSSSKSSNKKEDVLVKLVRVIANLSINERIGKAIAKNATCVDLLAKILSLKSIKESDELVLNSLATINNLSYYNAQDSAVVKRQKILAESLLNFMHPNNEGLLEATRVFGNLSREREIRDFLVEKRISEILICTLASDDRELVFTAVGVLINLMVDEDKRPLLKKEQGIGKLIGVLRDFGRADWQLSAMVCQILWNYSGKITSTNDCFGEDADELQDILIEYIDEDTFLQDTADSEMKEFLHDAWSEFAGVASDLLSRIESHQSEFEPLDSPS